LGAQEGSDAVEHLPQFNLGDRVYVVRPVGQVPSGTPGTIEQVLDAPHVYDVRFDGIAHLCLVYARDLALYERSQAIDRS
jgi:hypothetical protein